MLNVLFIAFALIACWTLYDESWFSYHPIFMLLAYTGFMANALYLGGNHALHMPLQILCVGCANFGVYVTWTQKNMNGGSHFTSWHSWIGIVFAVLNNVQAVIAFVALGPFKRKQATALDRKKHKIGGTVTFIGTLVCSHIGFVRLVDFNMQKVVPFDAFLGFVGSVCLYKVVTKLMAKPKKKAN